MKVYKKLYQKNADGKFYEEYDLPEGLDVPNGDYTTVAPPDTLKYPKWDFDFGTGWVDDKESIIADLTAENNQLTSRVDMAEGALLDLADMILTR